MQLNRVFTSGLTSFEVKIRLNKTFRLFNFLQREKERDFLDLPLAADVEPSIEGDFPARELKRTDFDFFLAGLALSDVCVFDVLNRVTCRGCICSFNELVKLAQITNFSATWVTDPIRTLHEMSKRQSNFFTNVG